MKFKVIYITFLFICAALVGAGFGFAKIYRQQHAMYVMNIPDAQTFAQVNSNIYNYLENGNNASLTFTGTISLDDSILLNCYDATWKRFDCGDILSNMTSYLSHQGCVVGSVDGTFAGEYEGRESLSQFGYAGHNYYNAPDDYARMLKSSGFDLLTMANYHVYDSNYTGLSATRSTLTHIGLKPVGIFADESQISPCETVDLDGITVGIYSYTEGLKFKPGEENDDCVNQLFSYDSDAIDELCDTIKENQHLGQDIVAVSIYFTNSGTGRVSNQQKQVVSKLFDAGADIVVGTNPDIVEPMYIQSSKGENGVEKYQVALYSLGSFITGKTGTVGQIARNAGVIAKFEFDQDNTGTYLSDLSFVPTYCVSYPTVLVEEDAGAHVKVFALPEIESYIDDGGVTKSNVSSTKAAVKPDRNGSAQSLQQATTQVPADNKDTESTETIQSEETTTQETATTQSETTQEMPEDTESTQAPAQDTDSADDEISALPFADAFASVFSNIGEQLWNLIEVRAKTQEETLSKDEYTDNLTKSDFAYAKNASKAVMERLFSDTGYSYRYDDGWYSLKH